MGRFVEYYEAVTPNGYEYYFMPVDSEARKKENFDPRSHRIWKFDTKRLEITELKNIRKDRPQLTRAEFLKIQLIAKPIPYNEWYHTREEMEALREKLEAKKSSDLGKV